MHADLKVPPESTLEILSKNLLFSAFPSAETPELIDEFRDHPNVVPAKDVLETGLTNINAVLHPPEMIMNAGWIEHTNGNLGFFQVWLLTAISKPKVIVSEYCKITSRVMDSSPELKGIMVWGVGHDHVDLNAASEREYT